MNELKYYGLHACLAIWKQRPQDLIRVYLEEANLKRLSPMLKWCAQQKKVYRIVEKQELEKISTSIHHEGVCVVAIEPPLFSFEDLKKELLGAQKCCLLYLDGVQNPHNLGSIIRSCAHFGILAILGEKDKLPSLSPSACRIAKGGAEQVRLIALEKKMQVLQFLKKQGFSIFATSSHQGKSLYQTALPNRTIIAFGSESDGLSSSLLQLADGAIQIPGTGDVESLNVSVAAALCLGEYSRQKS